MQNKRQLSLNNYFKTSKNQQKSLEEKIKNKEERKEHQPQKKRDVKTKEKDTVLYPYPDKEKEKFKKRYHAPTKTVEKYSYAFCSLIAEHFRGKGWKVIMNVGEEKLNRFKKISEKWNLEMPTYVPGWATIAVCTKNLKSEFDWIMASILWTTERVQIISLSFGSLGFDRMRKFLQTALIFSDVIGLDFLYQTPIDFNFNGVKRLDILRGDWENLPTKDLEKGLVFLHSSNFYDIENPSTVRSLFLIEGILNEKALRDHRKWAQNGIIKFSKEIKDKIDVSKILTDYIRKVQAKLDIQNFLKISQPERLVIVFPGINPFENRHRLIYFEGMEID